MAKQLPHLKTTYRALMIPHCGIPNTAFASISDQEYLMNNYITSPNDVYLISYSKQDNIG